MARHKPQLNRSEKSGWLLGRTWHVNMQPPPSASCIGYPSHKVMCVLFSSCFLDERFKMLVFLVVASIDLICRFGWYIHPLPSAIDNIRVMVIVWRLSGNIIRTALCWIVWHNVYSPQHTYVSSSCRSNRLGLSHWDPYAVRMAVAVVLL